MLTKIVYFSFTALLRHAYDDKRDTSSVPKYIIKDSLFVCIKQYSQFDITYHARKLYAKSHIKVDYAVCH